MKIKWKNVMYTIIEKINDGAIILIDFVTYIWSAVKDFMTDDTKKDFREKIFWAVFAGSIAIWMAFTNWWIVLVMFLLHYGENILRKRWEH